MTAPALERYVDQRELARLMGVSLRTIKRWTAEGLPSESWGLRVRRYLPSQAVAWARGRADPTLVPPPNHNRPGRLTSPGAGHRGE